MGDIVYLIGRRWEFKPAYQDVAFFSRPKIPGIYFLEDGQKLRLTFNGG